MEVNKYEAERCIEIARKKEASGDLDGALKFVRKSINLFPTSLAEKYELKLKDAILNNPQDAKPKEQPSANNTSSTSSSNNIRQRTSAASGAKSSTPTQPERAYTPEQVEAVKKIKLVQTDYYKVLSIEKDANESQIKKAYRKLALQFHPDKNGAPGADEAFKLVGKAFAVLSDENKRAHYDRYGDDSNRASNYSERQAGGPQFHFQGGNPFGEEIDPEVLFNMFFGGGGSPFMTQTFPNQRFRRQQFRAQTAPQAQIHSFNFVQLLPILFLFFITFISYLVTPNHIPNPDFYFQKYRSFTSRQTTERLDVNYWVNPSEFKKFKSGSKDYRFKSYENEIEKSYAIHLRDKCQHEKNVRERAIYKSQGFFGIGVDKEELKKAQNMKTPSCDKFNQFYKRYNRIN